jgi:hypothetical protein
MNTFVWAVLADMGEKNSEHLLRVVFSTFCEQKKINLLKKTL